MIGAECGLEIRMILAEETSNDAGEPIKYG